MKELPTPTFPFSQLGLRGALWPAPEPARHADAIAVPRARPLAADSAAGISVSWARHQDEVRAAQRLRYTVFAGEMGARLATPVAGHDIDLFDDFCEHLLVRDDASGQVIGHAPDAAALRRISCPLGLRGLPGQQGRLRGFGPAHRRPVRRTRRRLDTACGLYLGDPTAWA